MHINRIKSGAGSYRLVNSTTFDHMISTLELYGEQSQHPLVSFLIDQANESEEIDLEDDDVG
ncbi:hypothetical protein MesoLj113b_34420 [Mesorhizobium sp. 113-3-3]|nr:hypothetical protein MesoLj113b_34420 [Mesorhizobium sp. 113-3-3]